MAPAVITCIAPKMLIFQVIILGLQAIIFQLLCSGTWEVWRKASFFSASSSSNAADAAYSGSMRVKEDRMNEAASKFDHVDTNVVSVPAITAITAVHSTNCL